MPASTAPPRASTAQTSALVDTVYGRIPSLFAGGIAGLIVGSVLAWRTGSNLAWAWAAFDVTLLGLRLLLLVAYKRRDRAGAAAPPGIWARRYAVGAYASGLSWGLLCLACLLLTSDALSQLVVLTTTTGNAAGLAARNAALPRMTLVQLALMQLPMALGGFGAALVHREPVYAVAGLLALVFFGGLSSIVHRIHKDMVALLRAKEEQASLAERFETALDHMSHGLAVFDADRRLVVANRRLRELYGFSSEVFRPGAGLRALLEHSIALGNHPGRRADEMAADYDERLAGRSPQTARSTLGDGRIMALSSQPMADGGSVVVFEDITERERAERRIAHLAHHDALTDLPNRVLLRERLDQAVGAAAAGRAEWPVAVLALDLDRFKSVNDTLGHPIGDRLLVAVAERLRGCVGANDTIARLGGDEFTIVQAAAAQPQSAEALAHRIIACLSQPYQVEGHELLIGASVGIASTDRDGADADTLLKHADLALYRAKSDGRGMWRSFTPELDEAAQARRLEINLR